MLKKLLKYDIKSLSNTLLPIYGVTLLTALISVIFQKLEDITPIFRVPMSLITMLAGFLSFGVIIITFIVGIQKYYNQTSKDEGYLIHTLPVKKSNIILSKITSQLIFQILSCIITAASITIIAQVPLNDIIDAINAKSELSKITDIHNSIISIISSIHNKHITNICINIIWTKTLK